MRRSAAPSQLGAANKRPRFSTPLRDGATSPNSRSTQDVLRLIERPPQPDSSTNGGGVKETCTKNDQGEVPAHEPPTDVSSRPEPTVSMVSGTDQENRAAGSRRDSKETFTCPRKPVFKPVMKSFRSPLQQAQGSAAKTPAANASGGSSQSSTNAETPDEPKCRYLNVMWCKLSKKKHKKWEGDAILVAKGRTVTLLDTNGKEIGRGSGYKTTELQTLDSGHTLAVGGKEIEVMSLLSEADFKSGKCFTGAASDPPTENSSGLKTLTSGVCKPFSQVARAGQSLPTQALAVVKPRHDPEAPNALVMSRPSQSHQFDHNKSRLQVVDVVVDPYIAQHLRPHQQKGVRFLYQCIMGMKNFAGQGAILADEMGLGKTLQCISLIWTLLKQGPYGGKPVVKRVLVITPGSLVKNWLKEFKKWLGFERLKVFAVSQDSKVNEFLDAPMYPVLVVSYEMFMRTYDALRAVTFDLIICDEGHRLKNTTIKTTSLVSSFPARRRIVLTGTPVQNDLQELYSIVDFCNPGILGPSSAFRHVYEDPILAARRPGATPAETDLGETRAAELNRITGLFILRRTSDINNKYLPPKVDLVLFCAPSPLQLSLYRTLLSSRAVSACLLSGDTAQHLMCISALRKLCNHPGLLSNKAQDASADTQDINKELYSGLSAIFPEGYSSRQPAPEDSGKLSVLSQLLARFYESSQRERVVLVSNYTQTLDTLESVCRAADYQILRLDGQTPTGKRQQLVERFNSQYSTDFVFLLSSKAGGIGLNLIGASRLILYDIDWNPANDLQAMARVWRDGQRRTVHIYRLLTTGTIEEKIYQRQISKQALSGVVVDAKLTTSNQIQFSREDLRDLFTLQEDTLSTTHDTLACPCHDQGQRSEVVSGSATQRSCQIGRAKTPAKKNLCMDELLQWQHQPGPQPDLSIDPLLSGLRLDQVSFVFSCQSNTAPICPVSPEQTS